MKVFFEHEVHLHMKGGYRVSFAERFAKLVGHTGSYDPHGLRGKGAGFALCWKGSPQLLVNQPNAPR